MCPTNHLTQTLMDGLYDNKTLPRVSSKVTHKLLRLKAFVFARKAWPWVIITILGVQLWTEVYN